MKRARILFSNILVLLIMVAVVFLIDLARTSKDLLVSKKEKNTTGIFGTKIAFADTPHNSGTPEGCDGTGDGTGDGGTDTC